jgi:hypothetical protein
MEYLLETVAMYALVPGLWAVALCLGHWAVRRDPAVGQDVPRAARLVVSEEPAASVGVAVAASASASTRGQVDYAI